MIVGIPVVVLFGVHRLRSGSASGPASMLLLLGVFLSVLCYAQVERENWAAGFLGLQTLVLAGTLAVHRWAVKADA